MLDSLYSIELCNFLEIFQKPPSGPLKPSGDSYPYLYNSGFSRGNSCDRNWLPEDTFVPTQFLGFVWTTWRRWKLTRRREPDCLIFGILVVSGSFWSEKRFYYLWMEGLDVNSCRISMWWELIRWNSYEEILGLRKWGIYEFRNIWRINYMINGMLAFKLIFSTFGSMVAWLN